MTREGLRASAPRLAEGRKAAGTEPGKETVETGQLDGLDENAQRERIKQIMLAQAVTFDELERQLVMFADP